MYNDEILEKLKTYYQYLVEYNENVNLTAITDKDEVYNKHFLDSLASIKYIPQNATVCDIGTGAGFPGMVLKIFRDDIKLILVDSLQKRVVFLNNLANILHLNNIEVIHARAEDIMFKNKYLNSIDIVVARAVANMNTLVEYCLPFVNIGGKFIAYKSSNIDKELDDSKNAIKLLGGKIGITDKYDIIGNFERNLIIIDKITKTDNKYPRGMNKPRLKAL